MQTLEDFKAFLKAIRSETGLDAMVADETGLVSLRVDDTYNVYLQFIEASGKILCFVEIVDLPRDTPKDVYRSLLTGALFGEKTAGGYFTLEETNETVLYNYLFDGDVMTKDPDEFIQTLEQILQLCNMWEERIRDELSTTSANSTDSSDPLPFYNYTMLHM